MFFCSTCGVIVNSTGTTCPTCSKPLSPTYVSGLSQSASMAPYFLNTVSTMSRAKKVLLIGGIVLSLVAAAAAVSYTVAMRPGRSINLLPDGNVMAYVNFAPMHFMNMDTSPFTADPQYQRFVDETGLRVDRDLDNISVSANVDGGPGGDVAIIVTGTFDQQRLSRYVQKQEGVQTEAYGGKTIVSMPQKGQTWRFCVLDSKMVAITVSPGVEPMHAIIDKSAGSGSAPYLFQSYYSDVPFASAMWAIVRVPSFAVPASAPSTLNLSFLKNSIIIVSVRYTGSVRFRGELIAENQADATNTFQAVNGLLAMGKMAGGQRQSDPDVTAVMNSIEVSQNGNHVVVSVVVPQDVMRKAAQKP